MVSVQSMLSVRVVLAVGNTSVSAGRGIRGMDSHAHVSIALLEYKTICLFI